MSNGDKSYQHMVVRDTRACYVICNTDSGEPAVFHDTPQAELLCAKLRERWPGNEFRVISFQVL